MKPCGCYACAVTACTCPGLGMSPQYHDEDCRQLEAHVELKTRERRGYWDWMASDDQRGVLDKGAAMRGTEMRWSV